MPFLHDSLPLPAICLRCLDAPFMRFAPPSPSPSPALNNFRHPWLWIFCEGAEGGYPFFTHTKKEKEQSKISLSRNSPATLDAPFVRFAPAALKIFRLLGGGPFLTETPRGRVPKFFGDSEEGGMRFLWALFPKRTTPPLNKKSWTVSYIIWQLVPFNGNYCIKVTFSITFNTMCYRIFVMWSCRINVRSNVKILVRYTRGAVRLKILKIRCNIGCWAPLCI